jgi:DIS3-like exonuclease 2
MKTDKRGDPPPGRSSGKLKAHDPEKSDTIKEDNKKKPRGRQGPNSKTRTPVTASSTSSTAATPSSASQTKQSRRQSTHGTPAPQKQKGSGSNSKRKSEKKKKKTLYKEHWSGEVVDQGLQDGKIFRAVFRCSAADRTQGFVTIPGLPRDAFIPGWKAQNRAIEGDVVAVKIWPMTDWHLHSTTSSIKDKTMNDALNEVIMTPSMRPSPSGGEFPVAIAALDASSTEDECEVDFLDRSRSPIGVDDDQEAIFEEESPYSMVGFLADTLKSQVYVSSSPEKKALGFSPWESAGNRDEALQCLAKLLSSPEFEKHKPTAEVVAILEPSYRRKQIVGVVKREESNSRLPLALIPNDSRLPKMYLRPLNGKNGAPIDEQTRKAIQREGNNGRSDGRTLLVAELEADWPASLRYPWAMVAGTLGMSGHIQTEIKALLAQELVKDDDQFTGDVLACLPKVPWTASESEIQSRRDFRDECVFSIDPPTARDLDDALSIRRSYALPNGVEVYEIGVHIADVSHFVKPNTPLDGEAARRSTSTYLMDRVVPMLPRPLCEELCSLNPGVDRFTVSIVWHMTVDGDVLETWMGRSIIRSCAKLSYPMAQSIIKGSQELEHASMGGSANDVGREKEIAEAVLLLHRVASNLRRRRFSGGDDGALRLDNVRLFFTLGEDGLPIDVGIYRQLEAHRLVEEFMLAANMTAAKRISDVFPHLALLRCHPPPNDEKMKELQESISRLAPDAPSLEISSPGAIHTSLEAIRNSVGKAAGEMITLLCTKPMKNARYFCTGDEDTETSWSHYALAVPRYTHFTSPIRRYPDIIVHRLLLASLKHDENEKSPTECQMELPKQDDISFIASHANQRKLAAKAVQDGAIKIYLSAYLFKSPGVYEGVVMSLGGSRFFDVYVPALGVDVRCHTDALVKCDSQPAEEIIKAVWDAEAMRLELDLNANLMKKYSKDDAEENQLKLSPGYLDIIKSQTLSNAEGLAPMEWPIVLRPMTPVRLVIAGAKRKLTGGHGGLCATLWVSVECQCL